MQHPEREISRSCLFRFSKLRTKGSKRTQQRFLQSTYSCVRPKEGITLTDDGKAERVSFAQQMLRKSDSYHADLAYLDCVKIDRV